MAHTLRRGFNVSTRQFEFEHKVARDSSCRPDCFVCGKSRYQKRQKRVALRRSGRAEIELQTA